MLENIYLVDPQNITKIEALATSLTEAIQQSLDDVCPLQAIKSFQYTLSGETLALLRTKRSIRRVLQKYQSAQLATAFNRLNRQVRYLIAQAKSTSWQKATSDLNHHDGPKLWAAFGRLIGAHNKSSQVPPITTDQGIKLTDPALIAESFADHLQDIHQVPMADHFDNDFAAQVELSILVNSNDLCTIPLPSNPDLQQVDPTIPVTVSKLEAALKALKSKNAPGGDKISKPFATRTKILNS